MTFLHAVVLYAALIYVTWAFFLTAMSVKAAYDAKKLSTPVKVMALPLAVAAILTDCLLQLAATPVFLDLPREPLLTGRCNRYLQGPDGWRKRVARVICRHLLDPFQSGGHCSGPR